MNLENMIIEIIWFMLPGIFATMTPVFFRKVKFLDIPISKKLFGKNKTYRGFFFGIIASILIVLFQKIVYQFSFFQSISFLDYSSVNILLLGFLLGFGALFGDLVKSFFKRRLNIEPGKSFPIFDQIDFVLGIVVFTYWMLDLEKIIYMILTGGILHYFAVILAHRLKIR